MTSSSSSSEQRGGIANLYNPDQVVQIHIPQDPPENLPLISTCFSLMETENEPFQTSAYLCSILLCFFPGLINHVSDALTELGVTVTIVTTASERRRLGISLKPTTSFSVPDSLVLLGQAVVVLYKNAQDEVSYCTVMEHRINTLRAYSGVPSSPYSQRCISFDKAMILRSTLGSSFGLKKSLLQVIMDASTGTSRSNLICNYLCDVVAWSGMTAIAFIYNTLWHPRSPALEQPWIQMEVRNLEEAFDKITAVDHPKYFKILNPPNETSVIEAYRFPTIIALAKRIIPKRGNCGYGFDVSPRVSQLVEIHGAGGQGPIQPSTPSRVMQYNIEFEAEFVEEVMAYGLPAGLKCFRDVEEYANDLVESLDLINCSREY